MGAMKYSPNLEALIPGSFPWWQGSLLILFWLTPLWESSFTYIITWQWLIYCFVLGQQKQGIDQGFSDCALKKIEWVVNSTSIYILWNYFPFFLIDTSSANLFCKQIINNYSRFGATLGRETLGSCSFLIFKDKPSWTTLFMLQQLPVALNN